MKGRERKFREKGGHKLKKCSEMLLSSSSASVTNHDLDCVSSQSDIKVNLTLYCLCHEIIYIQLLLLNFGVFLHEAAHQLPREGTWVITRCVVHLYIRKKYGVSVYLWDLEIDVDIYWVLGSSWFFVSGLWVFFFIGLFGVFSYSTRYFLWESWSAQHC